MIGRSFVILWVLLSSFYILVSELNAHPSDVDAVVISKGFKCSSETPCTVLVSNEQITENTNAKYIVNVRPVGSDETIKIETTKTKYDEYKINEKYKFDKPSYNIFLGYSHQSVSTPDFTTAYMIIRVVNLLAVLLCFFPGLVVLILEVI